MPYKSVFCLVGIFLTFGQAANVQFFHSPDYKDILFESVATDECINLPAFVNDKTSSVKTDICIIAFKDPNCAGRNLKITPTSPIGRDFENIDVSGSFRNLLSSFRLCYGKEADRKVQVDFFHDANLANQAAQYTNVCGCTSLPPIVHGRINSVENYGNCIRLYFTEDCSGTNDTILARHSALSQNLGSWGPQVYGNQLTWSIVKSFEPCDIPSSCYELDAVIYKFEIDSNATEENLGLVELATKTQFNNNGQAVLTKEYTRSKTISETYEVVKTKGTRQLYVKSIENTKDTYTFESKNSGGGGGVNFLGIIKFGGGASSKYESTVKTLLQEAFSNSSEVSGSETEKYTKIETVEFSVSDKIEIPPCTSYEISSYITVLENVPITYDVYFRISGRFGEYMMTAEEVRKRIATDLVYLDVVDEYTVLAKTTGSMKATLGIESVVDGKGTRIPECTKLKA